MDDDQQQPRQQYWFPYWSSPPAPAPPPPRPPVRHQLSRRPSPPVAPSPPRRLSQHQPTNAASRGGAAAPPPQGAQVSKPSPSRASPLAPTREPPAPSNSNAGAAPTRPIGDHAAHEEAATKQKDVVVVTQEKTVHPLAAADPKPHGKPKDKEHHAPKDQKDKGKEKEKEKEKEETKSKELSSKHHEGDDSKTKEIKKSHGEQGKLQKEIKAGVADMVHKVSSGAAGHERAAAGGACVITLAGENKGASMKVGAKDKGQAKERHGDAGDRKAGKGMTALTNSNVQLINNSLLFQSSCSGGDPGVHLKLSAKSKNKDKQEHGVDRGASTTHSAAKK